MEQGVHYNQEDLNLNDLPSFVQVARFASSWKGESSFYIFSLGIPRFSNVFRNRMSDKLPLEIMTRA